MDVAYNKVGVLPLPSGLSWAKASVVTPIGRVTSAFESSPNVFVLDTEFPKEYEGVIGAPKQGVREVKINGRPSGRTAVRYAIKWFVSSKNSPATCT